MNKLLSLLRSNISSLDPVYINWAGIVLAIAGILVTIIFWIVDRSFFSIETGLILTLAIFFLVLCILVYISLAREPNTKDMKMYCNARSELAEKIHESFEDGKSAINVSEIISSSDIKCSILDNETKLNKVIIQLSFVITDKNKNVMLINRLAKEHGARKDKKSILLSFSPFPVSYNETFSILNIFWREVPKVDNDPYIPKISHLAKAKSQNRGNKPIYYFNIFEAYYDFDLSSPEIREKIFARNGIYFEKDHDDIIGMIGIKDLRPLNLDGQAEIKTIEALEARYKKGII